MNRYDLASFLDALKALNPDKYVKLVNAFNVITKDLLKHELSGEAYPTVKTDAMDILTNTSIMDKFLLSGEKRFQAYFIGYPDSFATLEDYIADPKHTMLDIARV